MSMYFTNFVKTRGLGYFLPTSTLVVTLVTLAGCCTPPATVEVKVPVIVPCVKEVPARPAFEYAQLPPDASDGTKVLALARDLPRWIKYEGQLLAVVEGCR